MSRRTTTGDHAAARRGAVPFGDGAGPDRAQREALGAQLSGAGRGGEPGGVRLKLLGAGDAWAPVRGPALHERRSPGLWSGPRRLSRLIVGGLPAWGVLGPAHTAGGGSGRPKGCRERFPKSGELRATRLALSTAAVPGGAFCRAGVSLAGTHTTLVVVRGRVGPRSPAAGPRCGGALALTPWHVDALPLGTATRPVRCASARRASAPRSSTSRWVRGAARRPRARSSC